MDLAEHLTCSICYNLFHKPVSIYPCLHNFCGSCFIKWYDRASDCPQCRQNIMGIQVNRTVEQIAQNFLLYNSDKHISREELEERSDFQLRVDDLLHLCHNSEPFGLLNQSIRQTHNYSDGPDAEEVFYAQREDYGLYSEDEISDSLLQTPFISQTVSNHFLDSYTAENSEDSNNDINTQDHLVNFSARNSDASISSSIYDDPVLLRMLGILGNSENQNDFETGSVYQDPQTLTPDGMESPIYENFNPAEEYSEGNNNGTNIEDTPVHFPSQNNNPSYSSSRIDPRLLRIFNRFNSEDQDDTEINLSSQVSQSSTPARTESPFYENLEPTEVNQGLEESNGYSMGWINDDISYLSDNSIENGPIDSQIDTYGDSLEVHSPYSLYYDSMPNQVISEEESTLYPPQYEPAIEEQFLEAACRVSGNNYSLSEYSRSPSVEGPGGHYTNSNSIYQEETENYPVYLQRQENDTPYSLDLEATPVYQYDSEDNIIYPGQPDYESRETRSPIAELDTVNSERYYPESHGSHSRDYSPQPQGTYDSSDSSDYY